jgi:hypothetical protein
MGKTAAKSPEQLKRTNGSDLAIDELVRFGGAGCAANIALSTLNHVSGGSDNA